MMKYQEKVEVMMACIKDQVELDADTLLSVRKGIIDGYMRLLEAEQLEQYKAAVLEIRHCPNCGTTIRPGEVCDCQSANFDVSAIEEGYGFWSIGGYEKARGYGMFRIAVSPDGEPLKEVARLKEVNGRHVMNIVYPDCYIIQTLCRCPPVIEVRVYRIRKIRRAASSAICELVPEGSPEIESLKRAIDIAMGECILANNVSNHYYWRDYE